MLTRFTFLQILNIKSHPTLLKVCTVMYEIEEKRKAFLKLEEKKKYEKKSKQKMAFKSTSQVEKENSDSKWTTTKVCLITMQI